MSKFNELYPHIQAFEQIILLDGSFLVKGNELHPCWNCGDDTYWYDGSFLAYLCSEECYHIKWGEFIEAYNR